MRTHEGLRDWGRVRWRWIDGGTGCVVGVGVGEEMGWSDICAEVYRGQKLLDVSDLRKEYEDWISVMHGKYDQEVVCGDGQSDFFVLSPVNKKVLAFSSDVVRVRKDIERKGTSWKSGQRIKILKGAAPGCHKNNIYATLEYILVEGFEEDVGGEALLICRPLDVPEQDGCLYEVNSKNPSLDIRRSLPLPISIIDLGKCLAVTSAEWNSQLEKVHQKAPSTIDLLTTQQCLQLELDGTLPIDASIYAGQVTLKQIVAVVRPVYFNSPSTTNTLDQKYIIKDDLEMSLELNYIAGENKGKCYQEAMHIYGARIKSSSHKELRGLYIFKLDTKFQALFRKAGVYTFSFSVTCKDSSLKKYEKRIIVKPCTRVNKWELINDGRKSCYKIRVGSCFPGLSVASYDEYGNQMPFKSTPDVSVKVMIEGSEHAHVEKKNVALSSDKMILEVSDILVEESDFHKIRPSNEVTLEISSKAEPFSVSVPCVVAPGPLHHVRDLSPKSEIHFVPGNVIGHVLLEMLDAYDNHTEKGTEVLLNVDGLCFQDHRGSKHEIDDNGCINLSGLLKVVGGYGETVSLSVNYEGKTIFEKKFQVEKRFLRTASRVPKCCYVGFQLENIYFEIVNFEGVVDETIDDMKFGLSHTLKITLESVGVDGIDDICRYVFRRGRCHVSMIPIPREQGVFSFLVAHSLYSELCVNFKINVIQSPKVERIELSQLGDVVHSQLFREDILALPDSSFAVSDVGALISPHKALENYVEVFERNVTKAATRFADYERNLAMLNEQKKEIEQGIEELQGSILPQSLIKLDYVRTEKEAILERINGKCNTAASVFCDLAKAIELQEAQNKLLRDMIGVVFQLGTVESNSLSRVLSDYLGEDQMLAVVCKSYAAAKDLEKYGKHGNIDHTDALHAVATKLGKSITGRFLVICLEDISPYCGECKGDDQQNKLALQDPLLPDGNILSGFLGYAVNMINLDADHLFTRTAKGHGLRETLFYLLFGDLQVYETREHLRQACCYTKHGAISLDGGIMKGNGVLSLGYCQPEICFPVIASEIHGELSPSEICSLKQIQDRKLQLENISDEIQKENKACAKARKKFESEKKRFDIICKDCLLLSQNYLEHKSDTMDRS
ncbi:hypothetical protein GIB67_033424 [Kingdonia uniflora]|uniref:Uncharacterized protein n=1 Tax=Kingdonia uniflora TaxID=39325 RepID=A0A7J7LTU3_9MAGN|nr:hypothetical protein GIB67_033424 [Kingdonia uniflora]